ncbi:MAG: hypothetical protein P4L92_11205 [Rudaea sp.]|nr:hypothetical protein [Rudaea sp.]
MALLLALLPSRLQKKAPNRGGNRRSCSGYCPVAVLAMFHPEYAALTRGTFRFRCGL